MRPPIRAHGSTLLLTMILLAVLAVMGVAAVALSSQERTNAATKSRRDELESCARAAQAALWAELLKYGPRYLGSSEPAGTITLPGGRTLMMGHYQQDPGTTLVSQSVKAVACDQSQTQDFVDLTNRSNVLTLGGHCYQTVARCRDVKGRELEVEFGINTLF